MEFAGRIAVVTGGGTGMGREMVKQLTAEGCTVAMCDVNAANMAETKRQAEATGLPQGTRILAHVADVGSEQALEGFRKAIEDELKTDRIHFLFNNAGVGGGGSFVAGPREEWDRTFDICWNGVYFGCRVFLPMLMKADRAHITNTSSVNGFWASVGPGIAHTAYPAAKFAVKGFTEALIGDLRLNAPHITCSVVMPGHVGTAIIRNTREVLQGEDDAVALEGARKRMKAMGADPATLSDNAIRAIMAEMARGFEENAPTTAAQAVTIILDGVRANRWRILVGEDARLLDEAVRRDPEHAYDADWHNPMGTIAQAIKKDD